MDNHIHIHKNTSNHYLINFYKARLSAESKKILQIRGTSKTETKIKKLK